VRGILFVFDFVVISYYEPHVVHHLL
jgi:hypothetical protein